MNPPPTPMRILDDDATKAAKPIVLVLLGPIGPITTRPVPIRVSGLTSRR